MIRVKRKINRKPNPLFEEWLLEWQREAAEKGSELQHTIGKALRSLRKYPFPLLSGKECIILENFGKKICDMLDNRLEEHRKCFTDDEWSSALSSGSFSILSSFTQNTSKDISRQRETNRQHHVFDIHEKDSPNVEESNGMKPNNKVKMSSKAYVPKYRSGAYAILITLHSDHSGPMTKGELQKKAQKLCDTSFTKALPGSFYTAWSSMSTLLSKQLVSKSGKPVRYFLTENGHELCKKLRNSLNSIDNSSEQEGSELDDSLKSPGVKRKRSRKGYNIEEKSISSSSSVGIVDFRSSAPLSIETTEICSASSKPMTSNFDYQSDEISMSSLNLPASLFSVSHENSDPLSVRTTSNTAEETAKSSCIDEGIGSSISSQKPLETIILTPGQFQIILIVDIHETDMNKRKRNDVMVQGIRSKGILCESRHLAVGDFIWVCRNKVNPEEEVLLPYIVERKRMDDLASSIKDGRFHEQKFRLKQCGLSETIYLVEKFGKDTQRLGLPHATLQQATVNTAVVDGFSVKVSRDHEDSMRYLAGFTRLLIRLFRMKTLISCPKQDLPVFQLEQDCLSLMSFSEFNKGSSKIKHHTVKEMVIKHLLQLKGVSVEKATAIADRYGTLSTLIEALHDAGDKALADIPCGPVRRIGPVTATSIYQLYTRRHLE